MAKTSVHIFFSPIAGTESRLFKACKSILELELVDDIIVIGIWQEGLKRHEAKNEHLTIKRISLLIKKIKLRRNLFRKMVVMYSFIEFHVSALIYCVRIRPQFVSCHNLALLPLCYFIKLLTTCKLIYEPHELETERTGLGASAKRVCRVIEQAFIRGSDKVVTVCQPITDFYIDKYRISSRTFTIRNMPENPTLGDTFPRSNIFRETLQIPCESIIYIYQGLIDVYRGIANYLETFSKLSPKHHLVIMGYGEQSDLVKEYAKQYENIHFFDAVPVDQIILYTSSADVGLFVIPGEVSLSYRYSLPNKFFEYAIAGLHICVSSNFEYLSTLVKGNNLGSVIPSEKESLGTWIRTTFQSRHDVISYDAKSRFRQNSGWQDESQLYRKIYC